MWPPTEHSSSCRSSWLRDGLVIQTASEMQSLTLSDLAEIECNLISNSCTIAERNLPYQPVVQCAVDFLIRIWTDFGNLHIVAVSGSFEEKVKLSFEIWFRSLVLGAVRDPVLVNIVGT
ncbi:Doublecortin Domain-Containing Protein 1 [Manis pentadactyla]|nr:Doublecortin Domain-Containing Protein 1 [Manis pentadactyla]